MKLSTMRRMIDRERWWRRIPWLGPWLEYQIDTGRLELPLWRNLRRRRTEWVSWKGQMGLEFTGPVPTVRIEDAPATRSYADREEWWSAVYEIHRLKREAERRSAYLADVHYKAITDAAGRVE